MGRICTDSVSPPYSVITVIVLWACWSNTVTFCVVWMASSRVGESSKAIGDACAFGPGKKGLVTGGFASNLDTMGMTKANVLLLPVCACASRSQSVLEMRGSEYRWISV